MEHGSGGRELETPRVSVIGYQVDKGMQKYRTSGRRTRLAAVISYQLSDYEQEQEQEREHERSLDHKTTRPLDNKTESCGQWSVVGWSWP